MERKALLQVGGAIVSGLYTTASLALNFSDVTHGGIASTGSALVGFLFFCGFVTSKWYDFTKTIHIFENKMPFVEVTPKPIGEWATLSVKNCGQYEASFSVKVLTLNADGLKLVNRDIHRIIPYDVTWKGKPHHSTECNIQSGNSNSLDIIRITGRPGKMEDGIASLDIYTAPETINAEIPIAKEIKLTIEVFAEPKLKEPYQKTYILHFGKELCWDKFEEER